MTSQEPGTSPSAQNSPDTEVIAVSAPAPVFVDTTGRRSRFLRRLALAFGVLVVAYGGLLSVSLAGGPVSSSAVLPLPGLDDERDEKKAKTPQPRPSPTPQPSTTTTPQRYVVESFQRRNDYPPRRTVAPSSSKPSVKPTKSASAKPAVTRTPTPTTTKPTESTTKPQPVTSSPAPQPGTSSSNPPAQPGPVPPVPPGPGDTGGKAGGEAVSEAPEQEPKKQETKQEPEKQEQEPTEPKPPAAPDPAPKPAATSVKAQVPAAPQVDDDPADSASPPTGAAP